MPKLKLKFDRKAVAGFFVSHAEKIVLVVVLLLFVTFVYTGYSVEGISSDKSPQSLAELTARADRNISEDHWEKISENHPPRTGLEEVVRKAQENPTRAVAYSPEKPYLPETKASGLKRGDPELLAPLGVEASVVVGPIAVQAADDSMLLLDELEDTEMVVTKKRKKKKRKGGKMTQEELDAAFGAEEIDQGADPFAQVSGGGPDIFGEEEDGKTPATAADRTFPGYRPESEAAPMSMIMVAVKALVPVQKQWDIFDQTLASAMHYNPHRDTPKYLAYEAQRADVTDADPDAPLDWRTISNTMSVQRALSNIAWTGLAGEIADMRFVDSKLTMPIPPIMMRKSTEFALHSQVPRVLKADTTVKNYLEVEETAPVTFSLGEVDITDGIAVPVAPAPGSGTGTFGQQQGRGPFGAFDSGPSGPGGSSLGSQPKRGPAADYLLVRCFDFSANLGRKYRYRVRVYVEDPNYPVNAGLRPQERALDDTVKQRLDEAGEAYQGYIRTEWSEPSQVVGVELPTTTLAGPITPARQAPVSPNLAMEIPTSEPAAKVLSIVYDFAHAADVPTFSDAYRGSFLNFTQDADVVHPVSLAFKKLEKYTVETNRLLVDFEGGEVLPKIEAPKDADDEDAKKSGDEEVKVPDLHAASEYIFLDMNGEFIIRNDLDDLQQYDLYVVPEKEEE